jgi:zeaxanthin glucosyltransferase
MRLGEDQLLSAGALGPCVGDGNLKVFRMGYYALLTTGYIGHLNPMGVLGRALMRRKHRVVMISPLDAEERIRRTGLEYLPICEQEFPKLEWERRAQLQGELTGFAASRFVGKWLGDCARGFVRDLPKIIEREKFDGLVMDQICIGAEAVCEVMKMPLAVACNALALNPEWGVPSVLSHWMPRNSLFTKVRNAVGYAIGNSTGLPVAFAVGGFRRRHKLKQMQFSHMNQLRPSLVQVAQQPAFFDFPRDYLPAHFHYTAPWKEQSDPGAHEFPWERLDGRPLIYASLGTLQNGLEYLFQTIAEACAGLDAQLVLALGRKGAQPPANLAGNPIVVDYAPQMALLKRASLLVTHAGLNTTLEAMREGLPMVAIPITNDQPGVSARIEHLGVGERIHLKKLSAENLRGLIKRVLSERSYREKATGYAAELKKMDGPARAAELIERAFVTKRPVLRNN